MPDLTAKRTLVKSPPELWEELSEVEGLAKHLGAFGEIKITKLEPEHKVAWEGEHASGTVSIEPSGWGTKVTLAAELPEAAEREPEPEPEPEAEPAPEAIAEPEPDPDPRLGAEDVEIQHDLHPPEPEAVETESAAPKRKARGRLWAWFFGPTETASEPVAGESEPTEPEPVVVQPEPEPVEPEPVAVEPEPEPEPEHAEEGDSDAPLAPDRALEILDQALDALGAAHHRPFSRG